MLFVPAACAEIYFGLVPLTLTSVLKRRTSGIPFVGIAVAVPAVGLAMVLGRVATGLYGFGSIVLLDLACFVALRRMLRRPADSGGRSKTGT